MSWDSYIDNLLGHTGDHCDKACIFGLDGGASWTSDSHPKAFKMTDAEKAAIAKALKAKDFAPFQTGGIIAEGVKYQFLRAEDDIVLGKKKNEGAVTFQSSNTAIVAAHTKEGSQQGITNKGVSAVSDYLRQNNM